MRTLTIQDESGNSLSFSGKPLHPEHSRLESEARHLACIVQESCNSFLNGCYITEKCIEHPPKSAHEIVHINRVMEDSIKMAVIELCSALDRAKKKSNTFKGKVFEEFCKNTEMNDAWKKVRNWRNKSVAHKINTIHDFKGYAQGSSLISAYSSKEYPSGLADISDLIYPIILELKQCIMTVYIRSKKELELQGLEGFSVTKHKRDKILWDDLSLGKNMDIKTKDIQASVEQEGRKLVKALKSDVGIISAWESTCFNVCNPLRHVWVELIGKIRRDPDRYKACNRFVTLVMCRTELPPTQKTVEDGLLNGFDGPYGNCNRNDLITIVENYFTCNTNLNVEQFDEK